LLDIHREHLTEGKHGCQKESEIQNPAQEGAGEKAGITEKSRIGQEESYRKKEADHPARRSQEEAGPGGRSQDGAGP
jgi:hypothetical protein